MQFTRDEMTTMNRIVGLPDDADPATFVAALSEYLEELAGEPSAPGPVAERPAPFAAPPGVVMVDEGVFDNMRAELQAARQERARWQVEDRGRLIEAAVQAGKIAPARRDHWARALSADFDGASAALAGLPDNLIPLTELGSGADDLDGADMSDGELDQLATMAGLPKGALR